MASAPAASSDATKPSSKNTSVLSADGLTEIIKELCGAAQLSNQLPAEKQLQFLGLTDTAIAKTRTRVSKQLCEEMRRIAVGYGISVALDAKGQNAEEETSSICSLGVDDEVFDRVTQTTDEALDYFNRALDNAQGIEDAVAPLSGGLGHADAKRMGLVSVNSKCQTSKDEKSTENVIEHESRKPVALDIEKPQLHFPDYPIDNSTTPFIPPYSSERKQQTGDNFLQHDTITPNKLERAGKTKKVSADESLVVNYLNDVYEDNQSAKQNNAQPHPFDDEINRSLDRMKAVEFDPIETKNSVKVLRKRPFTFVKTEDELKEMAGRLKMVTELAIDLENHSVRSFQGFVCLMQISTRDEDFIVDTLVLRGLIHKHLYNIFTDGNIVKVLHGADRDVQWLERDFGIYIVNLFDTGQAARLLQYASASLIFLQTRFIPQTPTLHKRMKLVKKKFQLADWRERPLSSGMLKYARDDTQYLLHIYDCVRSELSHKSLLEKAWVRSAIVAKKRHLKPVFQLDMAKSLAAKHGLGFNPTQMRLLDRLCRWRDATARQEDESINYVAPLHVLYGIVRAEDKARTVEGFLSHCFPKGIIPPVVRSYAEQLVMLICDTLDGYNESSCKKQAEVQKKRPLVVQTPGAVRKKQKSALLGSDFEDSSDED